jgi:hypothetical protein
LPDLHPFAEGYVMLFSFDGHAVPVDEEMLAYLRDHHIVDDKTTVADAQRFIEHHVKAEECHDFYQVFRKAAQADAGKKKAKAKT